MRSGCLTTALLMAAVCSGCGASSGAPQEKSVPVAGILSFKGEPLADFRVTFIPADGRRAASGLTDAQGRFVLSTNAAGDGAPPGRNKVAVAWEGPPQEDTGGLDTPIENPANYPKPPVQIPTHYADPERSGIEFEIPPSGLEEVIIELQ